MKYTLFSTLFILCSVVVFGQTFPKSSSESDIVQLAFKTDSNSVVTHYTYKKKPVKHEDATYYWVRLRETNSSVGDYSGYLQHGSYVSYYIDGELLEKGEFEYGLKVGNWKRWRKDGTVASSYSYKDGLRHGKYMQLSRDSVWTGSFKKGKLHGTQVATLKGEKIATKKYQKGKLKVKKVKEKEQKQDDTLKEKKFKLRKKKAENDVTNLDTAKDLEKKQKKELRKKEKEAKKQHPKGSKEKSQKQDASENDSWFKRLFKKDENKQAKTKR